MSFTHQLAVDEMIERYVRWREECFLVTKTYSNWSGAGRADKALAYAAHVAALDREESAAAAYYRLLRSVAAHKRVESVA